MKLTVLTVVVAACLTERLAQVSQRYLLGFPDAYARGVFGYVFPWLANSPWLDRFCALVMLIGLVVLRSAFTGRGRRWWTAALVVQLWHHFEYLLVFIGTGPNGPGGTPLLHNAAAFALMMIAVRNR
ncbi:hypothetical protein SK803_43385 [Lentzea sp. BCCO 10_0856]|uniref:Uncharacterized protein n=1 Tax=Lentzea miocenica TaxID=3095431 RepID=A0ABU4TGT3_9PSEU|nr:hypothetical protein [Lentzea sp. BCCO 10_0856]MDX8037077.1 hypothetical protein [Lentzea sp. BCCO 10_0856]